ncbi:hypothetical cytosolic protein [Syntrophus aciditrophicus SB]|uniref:Hypothetical cytosolic protein n=2 Tax=Syntrophus TaxID=43773 RepID=Q2LVQ0_SYNAS|nr:hypothetical cytosolic protein [Syntrophus aciditrophicus SB]
MPAKTLYCATLASLNGLSDNRNATGISFIFQGGAVEEMQKVLVNEKGMAWITCEKCSHTSGIDVSRLSDRAPFIRYKCVKCDAEFDVACEFRKSYRKEVHLNGVFIQQQPREDYAGRIEILDISKTGVRFKTRVKFDFKPGYLLKLSFSLDDAKKTNINQTVEVKWVNGQLVGGEFRNQDHWTSQQLGFYFMS